MLENENMIDLFGSLKEMTYGQLSQLIQEETSKDSPNDDLVLMALDILEDWEKDEPVELGPKGKAAWKKYLSKVRSRDRKTVLIWKPLMQVASVLLVVTLLFALLPTQANAETWWEWLARWTDDFFSFFDFNAAEIPEDEYVFQTENEGLQQLYDAVVELGVKDPVVPMWLPKEYELVSMKTDYLHNQIIHFAAFYGSNKEVVICIRILDAEIPLKYFKDGTEVKTYEKNGTTFNIIENNGLKTVTWIKDNLECFFTIDCQEDTLHEIIDSIYRRIN